VDIPRTTIAILIASAMSAGGAFAVTRATITARLGDTIIIPSRHIVCGVDTNPNGVLCAVYGTVRPTLPGYYMVFISREKVAVALDTKPMRIVYSAKQPKS